MLDDAFASKMGERLAYGRGAETEFVRQAGGDERKTPAEAPRGGVTGQGRVSDCEMISLSHQDPPIRLQRDALQLPSPKGRRGADL
jgi:hypothetical protein